MNNKSQPTIRELLKPGRDSEKETVVGPDDKWEEKALELYYKKITELLGL